jgi:site-specific DNA-cytosine methylase
VTRPLAIDLFCGLGGWTDGLIAEGYDVIGFDIERHEYGEHRYPAQLVVQDVRTLHGSQFRGAALIVASPPCQAYSYRAMPWTRAKALPPPDNELFETCFRIQREACAAAGKHVPLIVENVRGAQKWVGRARWNFGSFYLWGDVPALMPPARGIKVVAHQNQRDGRAHTKHLTNPGEHGEGRKVPGFRFKSPARKMASAMIAKIPLPLARHIGAVYRTG